MFEKVLLAIPEGVMVLDKAGEIIFANQALAQMLGYPLEEIRGKRLLETVRVAELAGMVDGVRVGEGPKEQEVQLVFPSEKTVVASVFQVGEGNIAITLRDVTEIKKLENIRREFVANVSHELKTPLTAIRSYAETLSNGAIDDPQHNREFLARIEKNVISLSALIDDLLELSQLEHKKEKGSFLKIDLGAVANRAIDMVQEKAHKKNIRLQGKCEEGKYFISGVEEHVFRAILNLLDNAVNYTNENGSVSLDCRAEGGKTMIMVEDSGIGISSEHLPRIFERFYRTDKARSRELGGTGLGLSIVKHIMSLHGGSVLAESQEEKGSKFILIFPAQ